MNYFNQDYLDFFMELAANNNKDWFDKNRKRYEQSVREPFKHFISDLILQIQALDPNIQLLPKDAIFRINRDIRFSKDKTPYKLFNSAIISPKGRKDKSYPGLYIELNPESVGIFGGIYNPDLQQIALIRKAIIKERKRFNNLINKPEFINSFGELKGKKYKRIPKEMREYADKQALLMNKQWYYELHLAPELIISDKLMGQIKKYYQISKPIQDFFIAALK